MKRMINWKYLVMVLLGIVFLGACQNGNNTDVAGSEQIPVEHDPNDPLPPMTTEEITLTYASWDNPVMMEFMAERFMERYPNITVEVVHLSLDDYNEALFNLASAGQLPDVFWYLGDIATPLENQWLRDFSEFFDVDLESKYMPDSLKDAGMIGDKRVSAPSKVLPFAIFLDQALFERLNVEMPSVDWTYNEMIELAKQMTLPEQQIFGMNMFTHLITIAPIVNQDAIGEFGWNGESFDFSEFAAAYEQQRKFARTNVFPPPFGSEAAAAAFGDAEIWSASTGQLAMQVDAIWTANLFEEPEFKNKGIDFVIYPVPRGDDAITENKPAYVDFGGISSITPHPREAYELLKWMGWGTEGWMHKIEGYATLENSDGSLVFAYPDGVPILNNEEIWDAYQTLVPQTDYWMGFLDSVRSPVAMGSSYIPGFQSFLNWMGEQDIWGQLDRDEVNIFDIQDHITENANRFVQEAMERVLNIYGD